jgi:hypothetical protein
LADVRFKLSSRGKPFPDASVNFGMPCVVDTGVCAEWGGGTSASGGEASVSRANYLYAWQKSKAIRLYQDYVGDDPAKTILFNAVVPLPESPRDPIAIDIPLRRLELNLEFPTGFVPRQEDAMQVLLKSADSKSSGYGFIFQKAARKQLVFNALGDGRYELAIVIPGLQAWESGRFEIRGDAIDTVRLRKGSDMVYTLRSAMDGERSIPVQVGLRKAGQGLLHRNTLDSAYRGWSLAFPGNPGRFPGLPVGEYSLEISAAPFAGGPRKPMRVVKRFSVREDSPVNLDLGDIWLEGAPPKRASPGKSRQR